MKHRLRAEITTTLWDAWSERFVRQISREQEFSFDDCFAEALHGLLGDSDLPYFAPELPSDVWDELRHKEKAWAGL